MKARFHLLSVLLVCAAASAAARAQSASEDLSYFGLLGQGNPAINAAQNVRDNACVPTSVANGLTYLQNYAEFSLDLPSPFTSSPNSYSAVDDLITAMDTDADGTAYSDKFNGLQAYLGPGGANPAPDVHVFGQASPATKGGVPAVNAGITLLGENPSVSFLLSALRNHDAVELGLQWGSFSGDTFNSNGGHSVTLDSLSYDAGTNSGTLGIIDPWGSNTISNHGGASAGAFDITFTITNGFIYVAYPTTVADSGNPLEDIGLDGNAPTEAGFVLASGQTARVLNDIVERVPDSGSTALQLAAAAFLLLATGVRGNVAFVRRR